MARATPSEPEFRSIEQLIATVTAASDASALRDGPTLQLVTLIEPKAAQRADNVTTTDATTATATASTPVAPAQPKAKTVITSSVSAPATPVQAAALLGAPSPTATGAQGVLNACLGVHPPVTPIASHHLAALPALDKIAPANAGVVAVRSGPWSSTATWGGKTPSGRVIIPAGVSVVFDLTNSPAYKSVRVEGCLELSARASSRLNTEFVYVAPKGEFLAGTPGNPIPANVTAEIVFPDKGPLDVASDPTLIGKGLVAASRVRLYGAFRAPRAKVSRDPKAGDKTIQLQTAPRGWRVGDRIVITGTRYIPQKTLKETVISYPTEDEVRFVTTISGTSVTLDKPLAFDHNSPNPAVGAYAVNYTRNIRLATENGASLAPSERAHSMYMSTETTIEGAEFFEMGRTDKSVRAIDASKITAPSPTVNVKGRYPLHLHQPGFVADNLAPVVRDVAIWGSPGWGIAHHQGAAFLFQNNTWDTFGAGFVAESGNETGAWVENTAIRATGVNHIVKFAADVFAYDLGRTGDGYWLQSRMVRLHKNLAVGMTGGIGFVFFHRGNDLGSNAPLTPAFIRNNICTSGAMRFSNQSIDKPNIQQFTDNEVIASKVGFHVVKSSPREPSDIRSMLDHFTAWEVIRGLEWTYTSRYTLKNSLLIGAAQTKPSNPSLGVLFGKNTYDLAIVNSTIDNFDYGVDLSKVTTRVFTNNSRYTLAGVNLKNIHLGPYINRDATDQILTSAPLKKPASLSFKWGATPLYLARQGWMLVQGTKSDSSGSTPYPLVSNEFLVSYPAMKILAAERGWYQGANGERVTVVPEFYSDRLYGDIYQTQIFVRHDSRVVLPTTRLDGSPADQGKINFLIAPPTARNDAASVASNNAVKIAVMSNDATNDGAMTISGFTHARDGAVDLLANGQLEYRPYPDFTGTDQFKYWLRNREGVVAEATVTVTVR